MASLARRYSSWPSLFFLPDQAKCLDEGLTSFHASSARTSSWREAPRDPDDKEKERETVLQGAESERRELFYRRRDRGMIDMRGRAKEREREGEQAYNV